MHSLDEVRAEYRRLDELLGIDSSAVELKISSRAKRRLGCFSVPVKAGEPLCITFSVAVMADDALFMDTVRHEYAHAAVHLLYPGQRHGHDAVWKSVCRRIGCNPRSRVQLSPACAEEQKLRAKYIVRCSGCGVETAYMRRGKVVDMLMKGRGSMLRCAACGSTKPELLVK